MTRRSVIRRIYDLMVGNDDVDSERVTICPETVARLEHQVKVLAQKIICLEQTVADATCCGVPVPDSVCEALYKARLDRRARIVVLARLKNGSLQNAEAKDFA